MPRDPKAQPPGGTTAPIVTGINPTSGAAGGGDTVAVTGTGFTGATSVLFGSVPGTNLTVVNDTQLTVTSPPPQASGTVDVTVTVPAGTSATSAADQFTYVLAGKVPQQPRNS
jgi:large repetitive protein